MNPTSKKRFNKNVKPFRPTKGRRSRARLNTSNVLFPIRSRVSMKDQIPQYAHTAGGTAFDYFVANSPYKPDGVNSTANLTALGLIYSNCLVRSARFVVTVNNLSTTLGARIAIYPTVSSVSLGSYQLSSEQRLSKQIQLNVAASGTSQKTVDMTVSLADFFGLQQLSTSDVAYVGSATSLPTNKVYFAIYSMSDDGATNLNLYYNVSIFYDVEWFGPVNASV